MKRYLIYVLLPTLILSGCTTDEQLVEPGNGSGNNIETTLTLQVPAGGFKPASTRALEADDENTIEEVDVLVFEKATADAADNTAVFFDRAQTVSISDAGTDAGGVKRSFRVSVKKSDKPLQFVVLANSRELVDEKAAAFVAGTTTRTDALNVLVMTTAGAWNTATDNYDPLPMWGQTSFRTITNAASAAATIDMHRAHARIDVTVAEDAWAKFKLSGVRLYNAPTKGRIAPDAWTSGTVAPLTDRGIASAPFVYETMTTAEKALVGSIYAFEAPAATAANSQTAPFLIIGGSWNGGAETFYRIDFAKTENNTTTFLPLLRNYHYEVNITGVSGRGFSSPAEATADSFTDRITTNVHQWAQGQMGTVVWDGKDWLAVSETEFNIYPEARTVDINVATTVPSWKAEVADAPDWLRITNGATGTGNATNPPVGTVKLEVDENTTANRSAVITVTAGRLQQKITVSQSLTKELELELGDVEMIFSASKPVATLLRVEWTPGAVNVNVAKTSGDMVFASSLPQVVDDDPDPASQEGTANYPIEPEDFKPKLFEEKRSVLTFTANDGAGNTKPKTITLRQFDYAISVTEMQSGDVYQQLSTYTLTVRCNGEWEMDVEDSKGVIASISSPIGEPNITSAGEKVNFTMAGRKLNGEEATLTFRSKTPGQFPSQTVTIKMQENEANSFIVRPGTKQEISLAKVFRVWATDPDLSNPAKGGDTNAMTSPTKDDYTVELLWQDTQGLIPSAADVGELSILPPAKTGSFTVQTANMEGNAVVVLKEKGVIRWSWHLWVTNYDPDATSKRHSRQGVTLMDRNLGALSAEMPASSTDIRSMGLLYQWGRKDPFPGAAAFNSNIRRPIYGHTSTPLMWDYADVYALAIPNNLANAVRNPRTYYGNSNATSTVRDWYTNSVIATTMPLTFWRESNRTKGVYDPCPDGWGTSAVAFLDFVPYDGSQFTANRGAELYTTDNEPLGFFPLTGGYNYIGGLERSGTAAFQWYASTSKGGLSALYVTSLGVTGTYPSVGYSVRCVKIE